ncbi:hypothetical protein LZ198_03945 [Myxococcus sp. K15C18031901]|uniref:hypothetical protein n=1 Tax=Myxococcus dinghuensis TaxID=2906761 RepID=UPI0020A774E4|nr:hypothetical protein [Myxococcus dinghuensis]MCP3098026.1 hypothetical protein [Myxococcus dinghuensis]
MKTLLASLTLLAVVPTSALADPVRSADAVRLVGVVHSADVGDQPYVAGAWLPDAPRRIEQFVFDVPHSAREAGLEYMCHLQDVGDSPWLKAGARCGTTGESRRLEAFAFRLTGRAAKDYTVRYWCLVAGDKAPIGPYTNGAPCGSKGESRELLGMKVELVKRDAGRGGRGWK